MARQVRTGARRGRAGGALAPEAMGQPNCRIEVLVRRRTCALLLGRRQHRGPHHHQAAVARHHRVLRHVHSHLVRGAAQGVVRLRSGEADRQAAREV